LYEDPAASVSKEFPPVISNEQHIPIIDAIINDQEGKYQVNVPNKGAIEGFSDNVVVEVPGIVSGRGVQAVKVGVLPKHLTLHILRTHIIPMELGLEAYLTGDKRFLLNRILSDPRTRSYEQAQKIMEATLTLPFNKDLKKHFK
jgi:alpha-galactosidase